METQEAVQKLAEKAGLKKEQNPFKKLHYSTDHLPFYHQFSSLIGLYGRHYVPILKARWYQLHGGILQKTYQIGSLFGDTRMQVAYPIVTEGGKNELIYGIKSLINLGIEKKGGSKFTISEPISFHPESLIGKQIERKIDNPAYVCGEVKSPKKIIQMIENRGHFDNDFLEFDECTSLITSENPDDKAAREYLSKAENPMGRNRVEKRSVNDLPEETVSYCPKCTNSYYFQPFELIPESAILQGFMRRKLIPVGDIDSFLNYADDPLYNRKLESIDFSTDDYKSEIVNHLEAMKSQLDFKEFTFTEDARNRIKEYALYLNAQGRVHSEKISNYCKLTKFTTLNNLVKMSCIISASHYSNEVTENFVALAYMDLVELLQNTFDFINKKVLGDFSYGTSWGGANWKEKQCLKYLYDQKSFSKENNITPIQTFITIVGEVFKVGEDQARNRYLSMKEKKLIDSSQIGKTGSAVWLIIKPKDHETYLEGSKGSKGWETYNNVFLTKKQLLPL